MISYLITVKDGEGFIKPLLHNLSEQLTSFGKIEVVIVDDGSTDNTINSISSFTAPTLEIKLIKTGGVGRAAALNKALYTATKKYVAIMDVDDLAHPMKTETQLKAIIDSGVNILFTSFKTFHDNELPEDDIIPNKSIGFKSVSGDVLFKRNPFFHSSMVIEKQTLVELGGYNEQLKKLVDYDLYFRAHKNGLNFGVVDFKLTYKRFHEKQSFENKNRLSYLNLILLMQLRWVFISRKYEFMFFPFVKYFYSLLPAKLRSFISNF